LPRADRRHAELPRQRLEALRPGQVRALRRQHRHVILGPLEGTLLRLHARLQPPRAIFDDIEREHAGQRGQRQDPVDRAMHRRALRRGIN
jgi:hypothetical protein